jgi:hypothetical protein
MKKRRAHKSGAPLRSLFLRHSVQALDLLLHHGHHVLRAIG